MARIEKISAGHFEYRGYSFLFSESGELCRISPSAFSYRVIGSTENVQDAARFVDIREAEGQDAAKAFAGECYARYVERKNEARREQMQNPAFGTIRS